MIKQLQSSLESAILNTLEQCCFECSGNDEDPKSIKMSNVMIA